MENLLEVLKVGDPVYSSTYGKGKVDEIRDDIFPLICKFEVNGLRLSFTEDGRFDILDPVTLFLTAKSCGISEESCNEYFKKVGDSPVVYTSRTQTQEENILAESANEKVSSGDFPMLMGEVVKGIIGEPPSPDELDEIIRLDTLEAIEGDINGIVAYAHNQAVEAGWHKTPRETGTMLALIHSEISEAMEGDRKDLMDDHLPHRKMFEVELADAVIRIFDLAGLKGLDLGGAIVEKLEYNRTRPDHKLENRMKEGGKQY